MIAAAVFIGAFLALGFVTTVSADNRDYYGGSGNSGSSSLNATAELSGAHEVPSVNSTTTGQAEVNRMSNGSLTYSLSVMNGDEITAAHLHCGDPGENGPVVVGLFSNSGGVDVNGILSSGTISAGAIQGSQCSSTIGYTIATTQELAQAIVAGDIYVNVHSAAHPNGVARGQLITSSYDGHDRDDHGTTRDGKKAGYGNDHDKDWSDRNHRDKGNNGDSVRKDNDHDYSWNHDSQNGRDGKDGERRDNEQRERNENNEYNGDRTSDSREYSKSERSSTAQWARSISSDITSRLNLRFGR